MRFFADSGPISPARRIDRSYLGRSTVLPATWFMNYDPQIDGEIAVPGLPPIKTKFTLDTGAGGTVISAPLVSAHDLARHVIATMPVPRSAPLADGVNGIVFDTVTARIDAIRIGPYDLQRPLVALSRYPRHVRHGRGGR